MKGFKKVFYIFIATLMLFTLSVTAFASNETNNDGNIKIQVATDKGSYGATGVAEITATITNVSGEDINNVTAQAVFNDLAPVGKRTSETSKSVDVLKAGESFSFTYKATLNKDEHKLNIFQKIILWFVRLFNGGYNANNNSIDVIAENVTEIKFGKFTAENVVQVGAEVENGLTDKELEDMSIVDEELNKKIFDSHNYNNLSKREKKKYIEDILKELERKDLIKKDSIKYFDDLEQFYFEYNSGAVNIITLNSHIDEHSDNLEEWLKIRSLKTLNYSTLLSRSSSVQDTQNKKTDAIIMLDWYSKNDETHKNEYEVVLNAYDELVDRWTKNGINSTVYTETTVDFYKTALKGYEFIIICEHGIGYKEEKDRSKVAFELTEKVTKEKDEQYSKDIDKGLIIKNGNHYAITPDFFEAYYKGNQLKDSIIYLSSCQGFGFNGWMNYNFSYAFETYGGAAGTLGFHDTVRIEYAYYILDYYVEALCNGFTMKEALDYATITKKCGETGPNGEYPVITSHLSKLILKTDYIDKKGSISGNIVDKETNEPIPQVVVKATNNNITRTASTDKNGIFNLEIPSVGNWEITFSSDTHTYDEYAAVKIEKDVDRVLQYPIYMTPKKGRVVFYSVKDSVTSEIINGVTIDIINTKTNKVVATRTTSDLGSPVCVLPYGTYDIVFQHDAYETYRETIVIGYGEIPIKNIKLQPKDNNSIGTVTGTVTNGNLMYNPPIYGVKVRALDNNGKVTATTTDENGRYTLKLPYGSYSISFDCDYYEHYDMQLTVSGNKYTRNIKLNPYDSYYICSVLIPSVKDSITNESICNVAVEVKSDDTNQIIKTMIISDGTSNPFHLPRGMYSITFIHEDYEDTCVNVHISGDICSLQTIYLTPQENFVTASGECGADGDNVTWTLYEDGELVISGSGAMTDYDDYYSNAPWFRYNSNITKVIIKNGITRIGYRAFYDCANIQSVVMGDSVTSIGEMAFCFCQSITNLVIPNGVKTIEGSAFASCTNLTNVTIGNNVTSICDFAFYGCINLSNITIPNSVTTIGAGAFYSCWNLKSIVIPNSVTTIGKETFRGCRSLISVTIPNSITSIEEEAFYSCESLNSITIPDNVTSIGRNSFSNCYKLTDVYYKGSATQWKKIDISIYGNDYLTNATIHYNA